MASEIDKRQLMRVFSVVNDHGEATDRGRYFKGLYAQSESDGYIIRLFNDYVEVVMNFHNLCSFTFSNTKEKTLFLEKLKSIDKNY